MLQDYWKEEASPYRLPESKDDLASDSLKVDISPILLASILSYVAKI